MVIASWSVNVQATNAGAVNLSGLAVEQQVLYALADGVGSSVDFSSLRSIKASDYANNGLVVKNGGQILLSESFTESDGADITIGQGSIRTDHITRLANATLTIDQGATVSFDTLSTMDNCEVYVKAGSTLSMPSLRAITNGTGTYGLNAWGTDASGTGSLLDLSSVTWADYVGVEAQNGAEVDLSHLQTYQSGNFYATGAGSVIDLSGLTRFNGYTQPWGELSMSAFVAANGGEIILPADEHVLDGVAFVVNGGTMSTGQFTDVLNGKVSVGKAPVSFENVRYVHSTDLQASAGGTLSLPALDCLSMAAGGNNALAAVGAGAVLDLSSVTQVAGQDWQLSVSAAEGGIVDLSGLRSTSGGTLQVAAQGSGSIVDLSALSSLSGRVGLQRPGLWAEESGQILLPETLQRLERVNLQLKSGGTITTDQLTDFVDGSIRVGGPMTALFANLTHLHNAFLEVVGATLSLPSVTTASMASDAEELPKWSAQWYGRLDLSSLTTIAGDDWELGADAFLGGTVDLSALTTINGTGWTVSVGTSRHDETVDLSSLRSVRGGTMFVSAAGENTVVDLSSLKEFICGHSDPSSADGRLEVTKSGRIILPEAPTELDRTNLIIGLGTINTEHITRFANATLTVTGGAAPAFDALTTMHNSSLQVASVSTLALPALELPTTEQEKTFIAEGAGALLDLSSLTTLNGSATLAARAGGTVDVGRLQAQFNGAVTFEASGAGSVIDLSGLTRLSGWTDPSGGLVFSTIRVIDGGQVVLPTSEPVLSGVRLVVVSAAVATDHFTSIVDGEIVVEDASLSFPNVTQAYASNLRVSTGGSLSLPALTRLGMVQRGQNELSASGPAARLDLSAVTQIDSLEWLLSVSAETSDATVDLHSLRSSSGATLHVSADGEGTVVDLSGLSNLTGYHGEQGNSVLRADHGGLIVLNRSATVEMRYAEVSVVRGGGIMGDALHLGQHTIIGGNQGTVAANVTNTAGILSPGDPSDSAGSFWIEGDYVQESAANFFLDVFSLTSFDQIGVGGDTWLAGDLTLRIQDDVDLPPESTIPIIRVEGTSHGTFKGMEEASLLWSDANGDGLYISYCGGLGLLLLGTIRRMVGRRRRTS